MLRPVRVSEFDEYEFNIYDPSSSVFAMQMFRRAMAEICYGIYQTTDLRRRSRKPHKALDGRLTRSVEMGGKIWVTGELTEFSAVCVMHTEQVSSHEWLWVPETIVITIGSNTYHKKFRLYHPKPGEPAAPQPQYQIFDATDDPDPEPAKM